MADSVTPNLGLTIPAHGETLTWEQEVDNNYYLIDTVVGANTAAIAAEVTRAESAESALTANLAAEVTRATNAEATKASTTALTAETTRAEAAEALLLPIATAASTYATQTALATEATARANADALLLPITTASSTYATQANLTAEASTRATADTTNATAIAAETTRATNAEALKANTSSLGSAAFQPTTAFDASGSAATVQTNLTAEATTRANADALLLPISTAASTYATQTVLSAETTRATTAEALLLPVTTAASTYVPKTLTVNGHALSANVTVSASDLTTGTLPHAQLPTLLVGDIPALPYDASGAAAGVQTNLTAEVTRATTAEGLLVAKSTTVNGHALSGNVTVSASDLTTGTLPVAQLPTIPYSDLSGTPTIPVVAITTPVMDGTASIGATGKWADAGHIHPTDTSRQAALGFTPVANTVTVNGHALSSNVTVSASDLTTGTLPHAQLPTLLAADVPNIAESQVTNLANDLAGCEKTINKGAANGYASLDATGKLVSAQIPALAIIDTWVPASQTAMLALAAHQGDVAIRSDINETFILSTPDPTQLANWKQILTPAAPVQSVNGYTGIVNLTIPAAQVSSDWNSVVSPTQILNKPTLGTAAAMASSAFDAAGTAATVQTNLTAEVTRATTAEGLLVANTVTVNGHALSANVTVSASDITTGTLPVAQLPTIPYSDLSGTPVIPVVAITTPVMDGTATIGSIGKFADAGHIHPTDTSRQAALGYTPTNAAVVPSTAPTAGQVLIGNTGGTAYAPITLSGPVSVTAAGVTSVATLNQNTTGSAASFTGSLVGDVTGTQGATTVGKLNGTSLAGLATGILKNTTSTGVPTIAVAGTDYVIPSAVPVVATTTPVMDGTATIGSLGKWADAGHIHPTDTSRTSATVVPSTAPAAGQILIGNSGGTAYAPVSLTGAVSITSAGVTSVATLNQNTTGSAASFTGSLVGDVTGTQGATVVGKVNGATVPVSAPLVGTNSSGQPVSVTTLPTSAEPAHTGDATNTAGSLAMTVKGLNGTLLSGLATGLIKNTTSTGVPTIAVAGTDYALPNANTTGSAASFTGSLSGDVTGTQGATVVGKLNGTSLAGLATGLLKNTTSTGVPVIATAGTDYVVPSGSITGTAANLSGTPALPNGTTATTQTAGDNSTKLSTTAYVATAVAAETTRATNAEGLLAPIASPTFTGTVAAPVFSGSSTVGVAGAFRNLRASATGLSTNVSVTADEVMLENSSNYYTTVRGVSLTIAGTASGANGLDTGTIAASTWYSVWVINNGTTTAGLLSLSSTAPTLPSTYSYAARIGWLRTDAVNKYPLPFTQYGRKVQYKVAGGNLTGLPLLCSGTQGDVTTPTWIGFSVVPYVPTTASIIKLVVTGNGTSNIESCVSPSNTAGTLASSANSPMGGGASWGKIQCELMLETTTIYVGAMTNTFINVIGWEDNL